MMVHQTINSFFLGTSTAATQIETCGSNQWLGVKALDGNIFNETIAHELHTEIDIDLIAKTSEVYRMSVDWSKLQTKPMAEFNEKWILHYKKFIEALTNRGVKIMLVCHHFTEPNWFWELGHWKEKNIPFFINYVEQLIEYFGKYVSYWNVFNEPNVYLFNTFLSKEFPPFKRNLIGFFLAFKSLSNANKQAINIIRKNYPKTSIGNSNNTAYIYSTAILYQPLAWFANWIFNYLHFEKFNKNSDFIGLSYYAKIPLTPFPKTVIHHKEWFETHKIQHDDMWQYYPEGLFYFINKFYKKTKKPIIICESGICTNNDAMRIQAIDDYLKQVIKAQHQNIPVLGYIHWSTFDNFEWHLGKAFRFGLVEITETNERKIKRSGLYYASLVSENILHKGLA